MSKCNRLQLKSDFIIHKPLNSIQKSPKLFSTRKKTAARCRSLSLVTWDSDAKLAIDPSLIGSSIEAYLSTAEKLGKVDEIEDGDEDQIQSPSSVSGGKGCTSGLCITVKRKSSTKVKTTDLDSKAEEL